MDYLTTLQSPVLINGYVNDIIHRRPTAVKELLIKAMEKKNLLILKAVLDNAESEHILTCNLNLLFHAIKSSFPEALDTFLNAGLITPNSVDASGRSALTVAIMDSSTECAIKLLEAGADPNHGGKVGPPPLVAAAKTNNTLLIRKLIEKGAVIDCFDENGRTPLFYAAKSAIGISVLLQAGASTDTTDTSSGSTPLIAACIEGFDKAVELMAPKSVNPNIRDHFGHTALTYAAIQGHTKSIKALIDVGADVSVCDHNGLSILAQSLNHKQFGSLIMLLRESPFIPNSPHIDVSPLYLAIKGGNLCFVVPLLYHGLDRHFLSAALVDMPEVLFNTCIGEKVLICAQNRVPQLQVLCRQVIRRSIGRDLSHKIYKLDMPPCILDFIAMKTLNLLFDAPAESMLPFIF